MKIKKLFLRKHWKTWCFGKKGKGNARKWIKKDHLALNCLEIILPNFYLLLFTLIYIPSILYYLFQLFYFESYKFWCFYFEMPTILFYCNKLWTRFFILEFRFAGVNREVLIIVVAGEAEKKSHDSFSVSKFNLWNSIRCRIWFTFSNFICYFKSTLLELFEERGLFFTIFPIASIFFLSEQWEVLHISFEVKIVFWSKVWDNSFFNCWIVPYFFSLSLFNFSFAKYNSLIFYFCNTEKLFSFSSILWKSIYLKLFMFYIIVCFYDQIKLTSFTTNSSIYFNFFVNSAQLSLTFCFWNQQVLHSLLIA